MPESFGPGFRRFQFPIRAQVRNPFYLLQKLFLFLVIRNIFAQRFLRGGGILEEPVRIFVMQ